MNHKPVAVHLIQTLDRGGCEKMLLRTLPHMLRFRHCLITLNREGALAADFRRLGLEVKSIGQRNLIDLSAYIRLHRAIKHHHPAIIISYLFHADFVGRLFVQQISRVPVIPFLRTTYNNSRYWPARLFERLTKPLVNCYLANSPAVKDFYCRELSIARNKIIVVPNGIDLVMFKDCSPEGRKKNRQKLGLDSEFLTICVVANLAINKGHRYLLEAFELSYAYYPKVQLLVIGDGPERTHLENQVKQYSSRKRIFFLGRRSDIARLLAISDIFVLPTLFEGMSNAILEAMAAGLAIVVSDIPENRAVLQHAIFVPVGNSEELSAALLKLTNNARFRQRLGRMARREAKQKYDLKKISCQLENTLQQFLRSAP